MRPRRFQRDATNAQCFIELQKLKQCRHLLDAFPMDAPFLHVGDGVKVLDPGGFMTTFGALTKAPNGPITSRELLVWSSSIGSP